MVKNVFVKVPSYGDVVVGDRSTKEILFITHKSFSLQDLNQDKYEIQGVVGARHGREVLIIAKENKPLPWADKIVMEVKDAILDGHEHEAIITYSTESAPTTTVDVVINYTATSLSEVVDAINAVIQSQADMVAQHWIAYIDNDALLLSCDFKFVQQNQITLKGLTLNKEYFLSNIERVLKLRYKNGRESSYGSIISMSRAIMYYNTSVGSTDLSGNVSSDIADIKERYYPINKSSYLGKSSDGLDHCSALRVVYGEGEQGWMNCLASMKTVSPTDYGTLGIKDGLNMTKLIASHMVYGGVLLAPAAAYCIQYGTEVMPAGNWYMPTLDNIMDILHNISYNISNIEDCAINKTLSAIGGDLLSNDISIWSCCRCLWSSTYAAIGRTGCIGDNAMYTRNLAVPISCYSIND